MPSQPAINRHFSPVLWRKDKKQALHEGLIFFVALDENVSYYQKVTAMMVSSWWGKGHRRDTPYPRRFIKRSRTPEPCGQACIPVKAAGVLHSPCPTRPPLSFSLLSSAFGQGAIGHNASGIVACIERAA